MLHNLRSERLLKPMCHEWGVGSVEEGVRFLLLLSSSIESPMRKRIPYAKGRVLMVEQVKPALFKGNAMRFGLSKNKGIS